MSLDYCPKKGLKSFDYNTVGTEIYAAVTSSDVF